MNRTIEGQPLDNSKRPKRYTQLQVETFDPRPDGLVYSSDGHYVRVQSGLAPDLEAIGDTQAKASMDIDAQDTGDEMLMRGILAELNHEISDMQIDDILRDSGF